jgi:hypothetical protein
VTAGAWLVKAAHTLSAEVLGSCDLATGGVMQQIHHPLSGVDLIRLQGA